MKLPIKFTLAIAALALSPACRAQSPAAGDWQGTLTAGDAQFRIAWHVVAAKGGSLTATIDNPDQGIFGVPVKTMTLKDANITQTIDTQIQINGNAVPVSGTFAGTIDKDATEIKGTWTQTEPLQDPAEVDLKRAPAPAASTPTAIPPLDGTWLGSLDTGSLKLRIVFKIATSAGQLTAQLQSPDQSPAWINVTSITRTGDALSIALKQLGATYEGKIAADANSIDGTFTQLGNPLTLTLKRVTDQSQLELPRPQNPVKPYPYREEDVTYINKAAGVTLAATLTIPPGKGPFPAVLLIAGSGPHDRDESLLGHKPFLVLSDYLTRKGIVVLRADKRGVGKSTGNYDTATTADFASDAEAGVAWLKTRSEVDPHKIGLVGHSEGGTIAPMAAVADPAVAFIVMMAGSGVPGDQIIVEQGRLIAMADGESKEKADEDAEKERETLAAVETEKSPAALKRLLGVKLAAEGAPDAQIDAQVKTLTSPWIRFFLTYDPAVSLRKLTIPVLALNGSLDLQVPPAQNLPPIRKALAEAGNQHAEVDELPGLNHLFQSAKTGSPAEYGQIEETISPVALDKIANWILKVD
jgi:fermentation-respiration switch protein FrsA (DUF1100 family)